MRNAKCADTQTSMERPWGVSKQRNGVMRNEKQRNGIKIFNEKYITKRLICEGVPVSIFSDLFLCQSF